MSVVPQVLGSTAWRLSRMPTCLGPLLTVSLPPTHSCLRLDHRSYRYAAVLPMHAIYGLPCHQLPLVIVLWENVKPSSFSNGAFDCPCVPPVVGFISNTVNIGVQIITAPARAVGNVVWQGVSSLGSAMGALFSGNPDDALEGLFGGVGNSLSGVVDVVSGVTDTLFGWLLGDDDGGGGGASESCGRGGCVHAATRDLGLHPYAVEALSYPHTHVRVHYCLQASSASCPVAMTTAVVSTGLPSAPGNTRVRCGG